MVTLYTQADFRALQKLPFCYLCGKTVGKLDRKTRDHIPPENLFAKDDRTPCLWLPAHYECNHLHTINDEKIGQLISLKRGYVPTQKRNQRLRFTLFPAHGLSAVTNLEVCSVIWRWVRGFHAALYGEYMPDNHTRALVTPFPRATLRQTYTVIEQPLPQHRVIVSTIKTNRVYYNLDTITSNNRKLKYECVWVRSDDRRAWICCLALNIYDWKDLGSTPIQPSQGCAGLYVLPSADVPPHASKAIQSRIVIPNLDPLDAFAS